MTGSLSCSLPLGRDVMSSTIIIVFCLRIFEQARCRLVAVLILVLPDVVHLLYLQHLHHENHDELHGTGGQNKIRDHVLRPQMFSGFD